MMLNDFGKTVRKARIDAGETLSSMASKLDVAPSFLSNLETGKKKIPAPLIPKVEQFFVERGVSVPNLGISAFVSNKEVSLDGLRPLQQQLIAKLAASDFDEQTLLRANELLESAKKS